jgi:hypothetical protein
MLTLVETALDEAQVPEIWETGEDKKLSSRELRDNNFKWALNTFRGKRFVNKSINQSISVSRDGICEWKTVTKSREQALSVRMLDLLLENGTFWKEEPPKYPDPNIEKVVYLKQHCKINGGDYTAIITVKVYKAEGRHKYYHHYLDDFLLEPEK